MIARLFLLYALIATPVFVTTAPAAADSCWDHNGSVMRLKASGAKRWIYYERPRQTLRRAGVRPGTLLFNGEKRGEWYAGMARVFSKHCPGAPLEYWVEGPVRSDPLQVVISGTRDVHDRCMPTGRKKTDTLVFTYMRQC